MRPWILLAFLLTALFFVAASGPDNVQKNDGGTGWPPPSTLPPKQ